MVEIKEDTLITIVSIIVGVISLGLTIYQTNNTALQIGFSVIIVLAGIIFYIYKNNNKLNKLEQENQKIVEEMNLLKNNLNIYDRLNKLEHSIFKR